MPFDGTLYQHTIPVPATRKPKYHAKRVILGLVAGLAASTVVGLTTEGVYPDRGLVTLLVCGSSIVHQNIIGHDIMEHAKRLNFAVGGHNYTVLTPDHDLTAEEQSAWRGFAQWKKYPAYSADGPFAIDP